MQRKCTLTADRAGLTAFAAYRPPRTAPDRPQSSLLNIGSVCRKEEAGSDSALMAGTIIVVAPSSSLFWPNALRIDRDHVDELQKLMTLQVGSEQALANIVRSVRARI